MNMRIRAWSIRGGIVLLGCLFGVAVGCGSDTTSAPCPPGLEACDGTCVDIMNDDTHCGSCALACGGGLMCLEGECGNACSEGEHNCDGSCVDTATDANHCGDCGNTCDSGSVCDAGVCASDCSGSTTKCGDSCVDTSSDDAHCGACDMPCNSPANCVNGSCSMVDPCGNGMLGPGEECDDGNTTAGDSCDAACVVECVVSLTTFKRQDDNHCYQVVTTPRNWENARADCISLGPGWDLAGISEQTERDYLDDVVNVPSSTYLGGNDRATEGTWEWVNGEPWGYAPWVPGEPNGSGDCARTLDRAGTSNDEFRDTNCLSLQPYLCELTPAGS
jgi:hypothetical protein